MSKQLVNFQKPKKKEEVLRDYRFHKVLYELRKPHSPLTILICTFDIPDEWLIDIVEYKTKSEKVTDNYMILANQIEKFIELYGRDGFKVITNIDKK